MWRKALGLLGNVLLIGIIVSFIFAVTAYVLVLNLLMLVLLPLQRLGVVQSCERTIERGFYVICFGMLALPLWLLW